MRARTLQLLCCAGLACVQAAEPLHSPVAIVQAWIRWLPANLPAGGYLTLSNQSDHPVTLIGVSSADYAGVALHRTLSSGGTTRMVAVAQITLAAHATFDFAQQGYHLMLTQPRIALRPGAQVPLTLQFADGSTLSLNATLRPPNAAPAANASPAMPDMPGMPGMPNMPGMSH